MQWISCSLLEVFVEKYWWKIMQSTKNRLMSDTTKTFMVLLRAIKLTWHHCLDYTFAKNFTIINVNVSKNYFSIVKIPLELVTFRRAFVSSRLNTWHVRSPPLASGAFSIWSNIPLFSTALLLPWRMLLVLELESTHNTNFVVKNPSHVTSEFSL